MRWKKTFNVLVDGHATPYEAAGAGYGGGEAETSFWVFLGAPGKKNVEVTLVHSGKTVRAKKEFTVVSQPALRLLDHYDGECLFQNESLRFLSFSSTDSTVKVNGKQVQIDSKPVQGFDGVSTFTIPPSLQPGNNTIEYSALNAQGNRFSHTAVLYFAAENKVRAGDRFLFTYGGPRSKSGPFYYVVADGNVLASAGGVQWKSILIQEPKGWIRDSEVFGYPITAKKAGSGGLVLSVKSNFLLAEELDKKINITVEP